MTERRAPRLYIEAPLVPAARVELGSGHAHYLRSVLRLGPGAAVVVFNPAAGEWLCRVAETGRNGVRVAVERQLRPAGAEGGPDLWLVFAPIKRARLDWLIEKATELGVSALLPIWTARTQSERINLKRLRVHSIEAAEQSERLSVPEMRQPEN